MKRKSPKARAPRRYRPPIERVDQRRLPARLWADALDGILAAMDGPVTPPRRSLAHTAASLTIRLGEIDAAVAEGREPATDHVRLAGQLNRTLRSLGIVENGSLSSGSGGMAGGGPPSRQKNVPLLSISEQINADLLAELAAAKDEQERAYIVLSVRYLPRIVRASCVTALATATPEEAQFLHIRLAALDDAEANPKADPEEKPGPRNEISQRKSFATHRDSPRRDE